MLPAQLANVCEAALRPLPTVTEFLAKISEALAGPPPEERADDALEMPSLTQSMGNALGGQRKTAFTAFTALNGVQGSEGLPKGFADKKNSLRKP